MPKSLMSKSLKHFAALTLVAGALALTPNVASAQRHHGGGGLHRGGAAMHPGGWHGGGHRWHGRRYWGGWGWGPGFALGLGIGADYPYYYGGPYYAQAGECGWVRTRIWRRGYWVIRRAWRCW